MNDPRSAERVPQPVVGDPVAPAGYTLVAQRRVFGSVVFATWESPDGERLEWSSRGHRKGRPPTTPLRTTAARRLPVFGIAPRRLAWWIAVAFTVGSVCFVAGATGAVAGPFQGWPNTLYFAGSVLFSGGAAAQLVETARAGRAVPEVEGSPRRARLRAAEISGRPVRRLLVFIPGRLDWNAAVVQLAGTLLFNINCFFGMFTNLTHDQQDMRVWAPSTVASLCFVIASQLAFVETMGTLVAWRPRRLEWWIVMGSLLGSWGFLLSSIAGFFLGGGMRAVVTGVLGAHGEILWLEYAVDGVLLAGSLCFLVGTYLMIPESLAGGQSVPAADRQS